MKQHKGVDVPSRTFYIKSMINDMTLVMDVMMKIVSGMFFNGAGAFILGLFIVGAFIVKAKLEQN